MHDGVNIVVRGSIPSQSARVYHVGVPSAFQYSGSELSGLASGWLMQPGLYPCMGGSYCLQQNNHGALNFEIYLFIYLCYFDNFTP